MASGGCTALLDVDSKYITKRFHWPKVPFALSSSENTRHFHFTQESRAAYILQFFILPYRHADQHILKKFNISVATRRWRCETTTRGCTFCDQMEERLARYPLQRVIVLVDLVDGSARPVGLDGEPLCCAREPRS